MILNFLLNILFPITCVGCKKPTTYLCAGCLKKISVTREIAYGTSSIPKLAIPVITATRYKKAPILREALHFFKYKHIKSIGVPLGLLMRKRIKPFLKANPREWTVIPLPLHRRKKFERGFNQNDVLAESCFQNLSQEGQERLNITLLTEKRNPLKRFRFTKSQVKLKGTERVKNIRKAFVVVNTNSVQGKSILLIDDVLTTGATIGEAATTLLAGGAREIYGFALARD
jgi:competence protein ComFC